MNSTNNYWNGNGRYQVLANQLNKLIPLAGEVADAKANPMLEKFRKASGVYYDVFNNGLCNRGREFPGIFGFGAGNYRLRPEHRQQRIGQIDFDAIVGPMDEVIDRLVLEAAAEQLGKLPQERN